MASKQVSSAFRLGSTNKLWGFVYKLDKRKSSDFVLALKSFLQYYFLRKSFYVLNFFFFFSTICAELQIAAVGALRTVEKERKLWFPKRAIIARKRRFWYYKAKPYQKFSRAFFLVAGYSYQPFFRRRQRQLKRLRTLRSHLVVCKESLRHYTKAKKKANTKITTVNSPFNALCSFLFF